MARTIFSVILAVLLALAFVGTLVTVFRPDEVITVEADKPQYSLTAPQSQDVTKPQTETFIATAYCSCELCTGKWSHNRPQGIVYGAGGYQLIQGLSMASALPFGTVVYMSGAGDYNGYYVCHDRPADYIIERYDSKIIDIYYNSHAQATAFGKRTVEIEIAGVPE